MTNFIGGRQDLITEVFAPWRSKSDASRHDIPAYNGQDATLSVFRAAVLLPSDAGIAPSSQGLSVGSKEKDLEIAGCTKDSDEFHKDSSPI